MKEGGLIDKWIKNRTPKNLQCKGLGPKTKAKTATLEDLQGAFYVFLGGITVGGFILSLEIFLSKKQNFIFRNNILNNSEKLSRK